MLVFLCLFAYFDIFRHTLHWRVYARGFDGKMQSFGGFIFENNATIRQAARRFSYSKSTVHVDVSKRLKEVDENLFEKVKKVLENNFEEKHLRGGIATKNKYKNMKKIN